MKKLKYKNKKTLYNGFMYDSKYEASVARDLDLRVNTLEIKGFDNQFKIELRVYDSTRSIAFIKKHKVDFRIHNWDTTFTLLEAKGVETTEYRWIRKMILTLWLPFHADYSYEVISKKKGLVKY